MGEWGYLQADVVVVVVGVGATLESQQWCRDSHTHTNNAAVFAIQLVTALSVSALCAVTKSRETRGLGCGYCKHRKSLATNV